MKRGECDDDGSRKRRRKEKTTEDDGKHGSDQQSTRDHANDKKLRKSLASSRRFCGTDNRDKGVDRDGKKRAKHDNEETRQKQPSFPHFSADNNQEEVRDAQLNAGGDQNSLRLHQGNSMHQHGRTKGDLTESNLIRRDSSRLLRPDSVVSVTDQVSSRAAAMQQLHHAGGSFVPYGAFLPPQALRIDGGRGIVRSPLTFPTGGLPTSVTSSEQARLQGLIASGQPALQATLNTGT